MSYEYGSFEIFTPIVECKKTQCALYLPFKSTFLVIFNVRLEVEFLVSEDKVLITVS